MDARKENKLSSYKAVETVLDENQNIWQGLVAFVAAVAAFKTSIQTINGLEQSRNGGTKGVTASKQAKRDAMSAAALEVAGGVRAYASANDDKELLAKVDYSASDFRNARDTEAATICQGIRDTANANVANLADCGVTANDLAALQTKINAYNAAIGKPRTKLSTNRAAGAMMDAEFDAADKVLDEQLDGLIEKYKVSQPSFYQAYVAAREIVDNAPGHNGKNGGANQPQPQPQPA